MTVPSTFQPNEKLGLLQEYRPMCDDCLTDMSKNRRANPQYWYCPVCEPEAAPLDITWRMEQYRLKVNPRRWPRKRLGIVLFNRGKFDITWAELNQIMRQKWPGKN